jgi:hypothetical protein
MLDLTIFILYLFMLLIELYMVYLLIYNFYRTIMDLHIIIILGFYQYELVSIFDYFNR